MNSHRDLLCAPHHDRAGQRLIIPGLVLVALLGSVLACIKPIQRKQNPAAEKSSPPATAGPETPEQATKDAAPADQAAQADDATQPQGQLDEVSMSPTEALCERAQASACVAAGRQALARAEQDPTQLSRAAMFFYQACDMGISDACYDYALMVWQRSGTSYNAEEVRFAFELAKRHGSAHATIPYEGLLDPLASENSPSQNTLYHYDQACRLGLQSACSIFAARYDGRALPAPASNTQPSAPAPQPAAPQPKTTPAPQPQPQPQPQPVAQPQPQPQPQPTPQPAAPAPKTAPSELAPDPKPMLSERDMRVSGALSQESIQRTISPRRSQLIYCYEKQQRQQPELRGELSASIVIDANGLVTKVDTSASSLPSAEALKCMSKLIGMWRFERNDASKTTTVQYRVSFDAEVAR